MSGGYIRLYLTPEEVEALRRLGEQELRSYDLQAHAIVRAELERRGLLPRGAPQSAAADPCRRGEACHA